MDGMHDHGSDFGTPPGFAPENKFLMLTKCEVIRNGPKAGN